MLQHTSIILTCPVFLLYFECLYISRYSFGDTPHFFLKVVKKLDKEPKQEVKQASATGNPFAKSIRAYPTRNVFNRSMYVSPVTFRNSSLKYVGLYPDNVASWFRDILSRKCNSMYEMAFLTPVKWPSKRDSGIR